MNGISVSKNRKPYVKIIEEPCGRGTRFRYGSEGRFAGSIAGVHTNNSTKTYPTIQIMHHNGPAFIVVSCVTKDEPYRPHPFNIVGKASEISQGICYFKTFANQSIIPFANIGIQCIKKKDLIKSLEVRERLNVDPFKTGFKILENIDLTCVRLCFQVFLEGQVKDVFNVPLDPVVSAPIYDKKIAAELTILWISHYSATVLGGTVVCLLCEKVTKDDIQVRFFNDEIPWEATAEFTPPRLHKQVAIVFKTPKYMIENIDQPVQVQIQLRRPSDGELSKPIPFEFIPSDLVEEDRLKLKRQKFKESPKQMVLRNIQEETERIIDNNANTFPILKVEPCVLPPSSMHNPNIMKNYANYSMYNQMNVIRNNEEPSNCTAAATRFNPVYNTNELFYNNQQMQMFNHTIQNNSMLNNNGFKEQISNSRNNCTFDQTITNQNQQSLEIPNEQRYQQNFSYLEELLTTMVDPDSEVK